MGVILPKDFLKVITWTKADVTDKEKKKIMQMLYKDKVIDYRRFQEMLLIHTMHVHIAFNPEIWQNYSKRLSSDLFVKLQQNLEF